MIWAAWKELRSLLTHGDFWGGGAVVGVLIFLFLNFVWSTKAGTVFLLLFWGVLPAIGVFAWARKYLKRRHIQEIIGKGYATSQGEYLLMFSEACPECLCRDFKVSGVYGPAQPNPNDWAGDPIYALETWVCERCGHISQKVAESNTHYGHSEGNKYVRDYRAHSHFLTQDADASFPDFSH